ncbi:hypothetical protein GGR92_005006 [Spirosoma lacussanchae]|uniref:hypothetical protein n=1 Tax=Spirosoma lacussanchae TaxID=1884249 RepID=UPI001109AC08|nr:hypothetical protein [Spirosoma lacussanchae]
MTITRTPNRAESALPDLLRQMVEDLKNPDCYYWLRSNYFDILPPTDRTITQWWQAPLFLDYDALWKPAFEEDALLIDVILRNQLPAVYERIRIQYNQIWSLERFYKSQTTSTEAERVIYHDSDRLRMPPVHNED